MGTRQTLVLPYIFIRSTNIAFTFLGFQVDPRRRLFGERTLSFTRAFYQIEKLVGRLFFVFSIYANNFVE